MKKYDCSFQGTCQFRYPDAYTSIYYGCQGAIGNIRNESEESVRCARVLLEETKEKTSADLESLEKEYEDLERKVLERTNECEVLVKFKVCIDSGYHFNIL